MTSTFTPNKSIEQPASGDYVNAWAAPVNANWSDIDTALGGTTAISVTGVVAGTYTLTLSQYRPINIEFTGTISGNIVYQLPVGIGGYWTVSNATTGSFLLSFAIASGNSIVIPAGRTLISSDGAKVAIADSATYTYAAAQAAAALAAAEASAASLYAVASNGSFTATCPDISGSPTMTIYWARSGPLVSIYSNAVFPAGTSTSSQLRLTGMPGSIVPVRLQTNNTAIIGCTDNSANATAVIAIDNSGVINFNRVVGNSTTGWTSSGTKEGPSFFSYTYSLL